MFEQHGPAQLGCLLVFVACSTLIPAMSALDVNNPMFHCKLCFHYIHCASRFATSFADIPCDQIGMTASQVQRPDNVPLIVALEFCQLPLPEVDGTSEYWIKGSTTSTASPGCDSHLISSVSNKRYREEQQASCSSKKFPFICEKAVGPSWVELYGRLFRRLTRRQGLCDAVKECRDYQYGGELANMADVNMTELVRELRLVALMPLHVWVNSTGINCNIASAYALYLNAGGVSSYTENLSITSQFYGLCEKRFVINNLPFSGSASTGIQTPTTPSITSITSTALAATQSAGPSHTTKTNQPPASTTAKTSQPHTATAAKTSQPHTSTTAKTSQPHTSTTAKTGQPQTSTTAKTSQSHTSTTAKTGLPHTATMAKTTTPQKSTKPPSTPTSTKMVPTSGWIQYNEREFYVNRNQSNFTVATEACRNKWNASLVFFTDPIQYIDLSQTLGLPAEHFWVGVAVNDSHHKCLQLKVRQGKDAFLSNADCLQMAASICSRASNVSDVVGSPAFSRLLADMKVDSLETQKSKRKLVSTYDKRKSAMTVGSIGVIAVISVFTLIALLDLTRLKCRCNNVDDNKMTKVKVVRTRKASEKVPSGSDRTD